MSRVPDGTFLLTALMDMDGDFQPLLSSNAGATCGDWVGAHVASVETGEIAPITVSGGVLRDEITIPIGIEMTTERPAFTLGTASVSQSSAETQFISLASTAIHSAVVDLTGPFDGTDPCGTMFLFYAPDANGDGAPDPHPNPALAAAGLYDVWPKVYLQYLGEVEPGESWAAEAVVYPAPLLGGAPVGVPTPVTSIDAIYIPAAIHTTDDGEETVTAPDLPGGAWAITVVQYTGQTWTVPNEVAAFPATDATFDPTTQGAALLVE